MAAILGTESELSKALESDQLKLVCQPLVAPGKPKAQALEIKIAWQHPRRGILHAEHFYDHIEDLELIRTLGKFILNSLGDTLATLTENMPCGQIYLHGLGESVLNGELISDCIDTLTALKNSAQLQQQAVKFIIDIDDSLLTNINRQALKVLQQLQKHDIGIAATGLKAVTPYTELLALPGIQAIKLDMTAAPPSANNIDTYNAMIACYHALNISVIAEGVNTQEISAAIETSDFDYLQGSQVNASNDTTPT